MKTEVYYQWKVLLSDPDNIHDKRLINAQTCDENSIGELLFKTIEDAIENLDIYDVKQQCFEENWILVKTTYQPLDLIQIKFQETVEGYNRINLDSVDLNHPKIGYFLRELV